MAHDTLPRETDPGQHGPRKSHKTRNIIIAAVALVVLASTYTIASGVFYIKKTSDQHSGTSQPSVAPAPQPVVTDEPQASVPTQPAADPVAARLAAFNAAHSATPPLSCTAGDREIAGELTRNWNSLGDDPTVINGMVEDPSSIVGSFFTSNRDFGPGDLAAGQPAQSGTDRTLRITVPMSGGYHDLTAHVNCGHGQWLAQDMQDLGPTTG